MIKDTSEQEKEEELPVDSEEVILSAGDSICDNKSEESTGEMTAEQIPHVPLNRMSLFFMVSSQNAYTFPSK